MLLTHSVEKDYYPLLSIISSPLTVVSLCHVSSGSAGGFFISGAFGGVPRRLNSASPADIPSGRLSLSLQLPRGLSPDVNLSLGPRPVHLPSLHRPFLGLAGHGAAAGPWPRQPRTLPLRLCSNVHLILLLLLFQERLGQSQGFRQQPAARPPRSLPASVRHWFSLR